MVPIAFPDDKSIPPPKCQPTFSVFVVDINTFDDVSRDIKCKAFPVVADCVEEGF